MQKLHIHKSLGKRSLPMDEIPLKALILGASEGIGAAFAEQLAADGRDLLLVARRPSPLEDLQRSLMEKYPDISVEIQSIDLGSSDLHVILEDIAQKHQIGLMIYNAAQSLTGGFLDHSLTEKLDVIDVNVRGPLIAADVFGRQMVSRGRGSIILVSSLAGMQGAAYVATYGASKAFDTVLAEGLWAEFQGTPN